jgi:hypothetical protein
MDADVLKLKALDTLNSIKENEDKIKEHLVDEEKDDYENPSFNTISKQLEKLNSPSRRSATKKKKVYNKNKKKMQKVSRKHNF